MDVGVSSTPIFINRNHENYYERYIFSNVLFMDKFHEN